MKLKVLTLIKRWWKNHRWVDVRDNYIIPHKNAVFWLNDNEMEAAKKFKKEHNSRFYQYCFTPGPIGVYIRIESEEVQQDITDYRAW